MHFQCNMSLLLVRMDPYQRVEFHHVRHGLHVSEFSVSATVNWVEASTRCAWASSAWAVVSCMRASSTPGRSELGNKRRGRSF
jgi:hypothetical protein